MEHEVYEHKVPDGQRFALDGLVGPAESSILEDISQRRNVM